MPNKENMTESNQDMNLDENTFIPDAVLQQIDLHHEEITNGCLQSEFLVGHLLGFERRGQQIQRVQAEQHGRQSH